MRHLEKRIEQRAGTSIQFGEAANLELQVARYRVALAKEVADTILYGMCLLNEIHVDAEDILRDVFNATSEEYGFPERI
jgi:phosphoribosyl-ATP pyrophosphohydrolase